MMLNKPTVKIRKWLLPVSWVYGSVVYLRNKLFDWKILEQKEYDVPIICVGNITVGGTGKTPHTEYIVKLLLDNGYRVAVLSRGYGRSSNGYILADENSTSRKIGDEPFQIKQKFPEIHLAVDGDRRRGIKKLLKLKNPPQVIVLDDAFQHRYVKPSLTVLLTDYNRPMNTDRLLPAGSLREPFGNAHRASIIIATKCPDEMQPIQIRIMTHDLDLFPYQTLFFTNFKYDKLRAVFPNENKILNLSDLRGKTVLLVTGIASPMTIIRELKKYTNKIEEMTYPDHHSFGSKDIKDIKYRFEAIPTDNKIIVVTEKDAARLIGRKDIDQDLAKAMYSLPIKVSFIENKELFNDKILNHVRENSRNS